jgi:hypothetical protein
MDYADLFVASTISNQPVAGSIIVSANKDCILAGVLIVHGWDPPDPHKPLTRDCVSDSVIFMIPGQYSLFSVSIIEECRSIVCSKEYHTF